jgi:UDP-N-acetylmuramoyl-tripeptide--D-alanyl-D-alanine ligase
MLELGQHADRLHEECGAFAASGGLAALVAVGGAAARRMVEGAQRAGMSRGALRYYRTAEEAAADVQTLVQAGDLVLVKGSRGTRMDVVADRVMDEWR